MMTRDKMEGYVFESLRELCDSEEIAIYDDSNPFDDLELDSQDGIELACDISQKIGKLIPYNVNPFVDDRTGDIRNIAAVIDFLVSIEPNLTPLENADGN